MDYFDEGLELFKRESNLLMVEVWHRAAEIEGRENQEDFIAGYVRGRQQRDDYEKEKNDGEHSE